MLTTNFAGEMASPATLARWHSGKTVPASSNCPAVDEWSYEWLRWPDFRLPDDPDRALGVLRIAYSRAKDDRVEIACGAGIGRTGTALAVLAVFDGVPPDDAVQWVRNNYHPRAVETRQQRRWIATAVDR